LDILDCSFTKFSKRHSNKHKTISH